MTLECIDCGTGYDYAEAIAKKLEADIKSQELTDGDRLMPVRQLTHKYETSYLTMRKAIKLLSDRGILSSRQGSGVYVTSENTRQSTSLRKKISVVFCGSEKHIITGRFYSNLLYGIEKEAPRCDAEIAVSMLRDPREFVERDACSRSDGFLVVGEDVPGLADVLKGKPTVWMMGSEKKWGDHISYDNRLVGVFAAEELVAAGKKNMMCINVDAVTGDERCHAFKEHAESLGANVLYLNHPEALIITESEQHIDFDALSGWVDQIEGALPDLNGVFVVDMVAYPLYNMLVERGIKPGRDIEIATSNWYDHIAGGTQYQPFNILLHPEEVGSMSMRQLRWRIENPEARRMVMRIEPERGGRAGIRGR